MNSNIIKANKILLQLKLLDIDIYNIYSEKLRKQDKFIPKEELDKYDDEGNLMGSEKIPEYIKYIYKTDGYKVNGVIYKVVKWKPENVWVEDNSLVNYNNGELCMDSLFTRTHQWEFSTREAYEAQFKKDEEFKVGDKVICIQKVGFKVDGVNYSKDLEIGKLYTVIRKAYNYMFTKELGIDVKEDSYTHPISNFRKALPHEIPVENTIKKYPIPFEESFKYTIGADPITAQTWAISDYAVSVGPILDKIKLNWNSSEKITRGLKKTPDLIDKTKVKVEIKRAKVKQIKL